MKIEDWKLKIKNYKSKNQKWIIQKSKLEIHNLKFEIGDSEVEIKIQTLQYNCISLSKCIVIWPASPKNVLLHSNIR